MTITRDELIRRFSYHSPTESKAELHKRVRDMVYGCAVTVVKLTPSSPEQSISIRKLEEALFYANAAIARNEFEVPNDGA